MEEVVAYARDGHVGLITLRRPDRLKYVAGVELGAGTFVNDTLPEETASQLRAACRLA